MGYPTLTCEVSDYRAVFIGQAEHPFQQFNLLYLKGSTGEVAATWICNPDTSVFVPPSSMNNLTANDVQELWPPIVGLMVAGFIVKRLREAF